MIKYSTGGISSLLNIFLCHGSVFPGALLVATPCALVTCVMNHFYNEEASWTGFLEQEVITESAAWNGFSFLVGFLIVFRTSQSYARFWDGCTSTHQMRAEWFDGCSALIAFCAHSKADQELILNFQNRLVRLFSMLHAMALAEIEDSSTNEIDDVNAFKYGLIDVESIDPQSIKALKNCESKVELTFQWIQLLVVENISTGVLSIPPPILSRCFQEMANGMVQFHEAMKISFIPFPFPYAQTCDCLLVLHLLVTPFVVCQWVTHPFWAFVFSFIQVFILWSLNMIAVELENPFGMDANDIDGLHMQEELNQHLLLLMRPYARRTPQLKDGFKCLTTRDTNTQLGLLKKAKSMYDVWTENEPHEKDDKANARGFSVMDANPDGIMTFTSFKETRSVKSAEPSDWARLATTVATQSDEQEHEDAAASAAQGFNRPPRFSSDSYSTIPVPYQNRMSSLENDLVNATASFTVCSMAPLSTPDFTPFALGKAQEVDIPREGSAQKAKKGHGINVTAKTGSSQDGGPDDLTFPEPASYNVDREGETHALPQQVHADKVRPLMGSRYGSIRSQGGLEVPDSGDLHPGTSAERREDPSPVPTKASIGRHVAINAEPITFSLDSERLPSVPPSDRSRQQVDRR